MHYGDILICCQLIIQNWDGVSYKQKFEDLLNWWHNLQVLISFMGSIWLPSFACGSCSVQYVKFLFHNFHPLT